MIDRHTTFVVWAVLGAVVVVGHVLAVLSKGRFPGLGKLVELASTSRVGAYVLALAWMWLGWHAFAR